jgi:hypothetical protein
MELSAPSVCPLLASFLPILGKFARKTDQNTLEKAAESEKSTLKPSRRGRDIVILGKIRNF